MNYFKINYNMLKEMIEENKGCYDSGDIVSLLEFGFINQQQFEDLMTVINVPEYDFNHFYQKDYGYYRQQGPLTDIQMTNDITAGQDKKVVANNMNNRLKHKRLYRKADTNVNNFDEMTLDDKVDVIYRDMKKNPGHYEKTFKEFAKIFNNDLEKITDDPNNYRDTYDGNPRYQTDVDEEELMFSAFANDSADEFAYAISDLFNKPVDEIEDVLEAALTDDGIIEELTDGSYKYMKNKEELEKKMQKEVENDIADSKESLL